MPKTALRTHWGQYEFVVMPFSPSPTLVTVCLGFFFYDMLLSQ